MSSGDSVQQIKERLSIVDVVSPYVELHQAGKNYKGKSPFTNEKTPSFYVSPDKGMYYCFSSSQGGDIFTFIQSMEGVEFKEALKILAEKAGVELVPEDPKKRSERETGLSILDAACTFYQKKLQTHDGAKKYLTDRGVTAETIAKWRIGYAPGPPDGGWREVRNFLTASKHTDAALLSAGLVKAADGKEPYDVFRDRIMFPIFDASGKVVAFSGRILTKDSDAPKYVNSPETAFFNKSEVLYGYDKAKQGIRQYDFSLIVEGQFDVVLAHQAGYTNTVAVSGTALTAYHVGLLQRLSNRVVLALDADRAGIAAVKRAAELMLARGIDLKVARIPVGADPADMILEDPHSFKTTIGKATHVIEFLLTILKEETADARTYKLKVRDEVLPYVAHMQNEIDVDHFIAVVATAIETSKDAISLEVARIRESEAARPTAVRTVIEKRVVGAPKQRERGREKELTGYLAVAVGLIAPDMAAALERRFTEVCGADPQTCEEQLDTNVRSELMFRIESLYEEYSERQLKEDLMGKMHELELLLLRRAIAEKKQALFDAERADNADVVTELLTEVGELQKQLARASDPTDLFAAPPAEDEKT